MEEYFDLDFIQTYGLSVKTDYDPNSKETIWYKDTRDKLYYLVNLLNKKLSQSLFISYKERPRIQGGPGKFVYKDYVLVGVTTGNFKEEKRIFIKIALHELSTNPTFCVEIDINYKKYTDLKIKETNSFNVVIDENFPKNWEGLCDLIINQGQLKDYYIKNFEEIVATLNGEKVVTVEKKMEQQENTKSVSKSNMPLNQILFGPPGTGKTYNTVNEALKIVDPKFYADHKEDRGKLTERYRKLLINDWNNTSGQIAFCTFHQSFSYEDFVEGIKPCLSIEDGSTLRYEVESGIFKKICDLADSKKGNYDEVIEKFKQEISEFEGKEPIKIVANSTFDVTYKGGNVFYVSPLNSKKDNAWYAVSLNNIKKYFETGDLTGTYNTTYVKGICNFLLEKRGLNKSVNEEAADKDFVLVIDEINRGNVSSIFGELITLIEDDKRIDADEELRVILPYSKDLFGVPKNVHIIGTMNTADRSIEALDTALRRRFTFKEMPPQVDLIKTSGTLKNTGGVLDELDLVEMLKVINKRIERLIDKDHKIGHAYFLKVKTKEDLVETFRNKVIPLLEEYFFGDFGKIGLVLGNSFVEKVNGNFEFASFKEYDSDITDDLKKRCVYGIRQSSDWNFKSIYTTNTAQ